MTNLVRVLFFLLVGMLLSSMRATAASTPIYLPSLGANATGTAVGAKNTLDVSIPAGVTFNDPAEGAPAAATPAEAILVGGNDGGTLRALTLDTSGRPTVNRNWTLLDSTDSVTAHQGGTWNLNNISGTISLPTGASTELKQDAIIAELQNVLAEVDAINTKTTQVDTGNVTITSSVLPTGAATEATLSTLNGKVTAVDTGNVTVASSALPTGASTEATLSTLNGKVTAVDTGNVTVSSSALPTGAATEATLSAVETLLDDVSAATGAGALPAQAIRIAGEDASSPGDFISIKTNSTGELITRSQTRAWTLNSGSDSVAVAGTVNNQPATPTARTVKQAALTVGTSAVRLTHDAGAPSSTRVALRFRSDDANTANCYWGSSSVASSGGSRGMKIYAGESVEIEMDAGDYYAICDAAAQTLYVVEQE